MVKFKDGVNSVWVYLLRKDDESSEYTGFVNMGYDHFDDVQIVYIFAKETKRNYPFYNNF